MKYYTPTPQEFLPPSPPLVILYLKGKDYKEKIFFCIKIFG